MSNIRQPVVAGRFYAEQPEACRRQVEQCIPSNVPELAADIEAVGAVVPHAGWVCSGMVTGRTLRAVMDHSAADTIILVGAVHAIRSPRAALYADGAWETPLGRVEVDAELAAAVARSTPLIEIDREAHRREHSLEVQVPFVQRLCPMARIVPIMVPPILEAERIGQCIGQIVVQRAPRAVIIGTSDLTHYGPGYGLISHGIGQRGLDWARNDNDRRMIDYIVALDAGAIVPEAAAHLNACGAGAIAATIAACRELGARRGMLLAHTTSQETLRGQVTGPVTDAVGYAGVIFTR